MKRITSMFAIVTVILACSALALAQEGGKPVIGIKAFENPPNYYNSTIGNGLSDLFTTELMKTNKYRRSFGCI